MILYVYLPVCCACVLVLCVCVYQTLELLSKFKSQLFTARRSEEDSATPPQPAVPAEGETEEEELKREEGEGEGEMPKRQIWQVA